MTRLRLIAFDAEDLGVVSAHLQDALLKVADLAYLPCDKRFVLLANRFDWAAAAEDRPNELLRRRSGLRFERVLGVKISGIDLARKEDILSLLAIQFAPKAADDPAGHVTLVFAGNAAIRLEVECVEAELKDLDAAWKARSKPRHLASELK